MTLTATITKLEQCIHDLDTGVAVLDTATEELLFENRTFGNWFPAQETPGLFSRRLPGLDMDRARRRLDRGRPFNYEHEIGTGATAMTLNVSLRQGEMEGRRVYLVQCQNVSKQKEAEYMLDSYSRMAEKSARELRKEKQRAEKLLLNIMPRPVYEELRDLGTTTPQHFESATVLMLDFVDFTEMAVSRDPSALIAELNDIFSAFDRIVELFDCERIKTIGDAYIAVSGMPEDNPDHASSIAKVALRMRRYLERRNAQNENVWRCRIGVATGSLIGSLVGIQRYVYDIFGPAVNLAARVEQRCAPMEILLTESTKNLIEDEFLCDEHGLEDLKGFGPVSTFSLTGESKV